MSHHYFIQVVLLTMASSKIKRIERQMDRASNYQEWKMLAQAHDDASGMSKWKKKEECELYDNREIKLRLGALQEYREKGDDEGLLFALNEGIHGNMGGMGKEGLYNKAKFGTKKLIVDYVNEVANALLHLADFENSNISFVDKLEFFHRASICFGRSALMLSGGGQLGNFHLGVLKALALHHLLPNVISGSSAGSVFAALAGTNTDEELVDFLKNERLLDMMEEEADVYEEMLTGNKIEADHLEVMVNKLIPNLTFQEAFDHTGRKINISIAPQETNQKSRLLNAVASPNVLIRSAVMASCAIPGVYPPVMLKAKDRNGDIKPYLPSRRWVDGSMSNDLPSKRLTRLYGINHFIVSLTNPLILAFKRKPSKFNDLLAPGRRLGMAFLRETSHFNYTLTKSFFGYLPKPVTFAANAWNSVVQQDYTGDINIHANFSLLKTGNLLSYWSPEELSLLIDEGERATWPKMEAIRITTKIGRVLDEILSLYESEVEKLEQRYFKELITE